MKTKIAYVLEWDNGESYEDNYHYPVAVFLDKKRAEDKVSEINKMVNDIIEIQPKRLNINEVGEEEFSRQYMALEKHFGDAKLPYEISISQYERGSSSIREVVLET